MDHPVFHEDWWQWGICFAHLLNRSQVASTSTAAQEGFTSSRTHGSWRGAVCSDFGTLLPQPSMGNCRDPEKRWKTPTISHTICHTTLPIQNLSEFVKPAYGKVFTELLGSLEKWGSCFSSTCSLQTSSDSNGMDVWWWMETPIFHGKDSVHHPTDSQPFIWPNSSNLTRPGPPKMSWGKEICWIFRENN